MLRSSGPENERSMALEISSWRCLLLSFFFCSLWLHNCLPLFFPFGWDASCSAFCRSKAAQSEVPGRWDSRTLHQRLHRSCWKAMVAALSVLCCWKLADNRFLPFVDRTHFEWCIQMGRHWHTRCSRGSADIVHIGSLLDRSRKRQDRRESCTPGMSWSCRRTCLTGMRPDTIVWCSLWLWTSTLCRTVVHTGKNLWKVRKRERERERERERNACWWQACIGQKSKLMIMKGFWMMKTSKDGFEQTTFR